MRSACSSPGCAAVGLRMALSELVNPPFYWTLLPFIAIFLAAYALRGLYPAVGLSPVEELRRLSVSTSVVFLILTGITFWARTAEFYSRLVFAFSWVLALICVPLGRSALRLLASRLGLWGEPVAVIGAAAEARRVAEYLQGRIRLGIRPVALMDVDQDEPAPESVHTAILVLEGMPAAEQQAVISRQAAGFRRLILITDLSWTGSLGLTPYDLEGLLGLEVRQNLLNPLQQDLKRLSDFAGGLALGLLALLPAALIALLVRLDLPGGVFYAHQRLGKDGHTIRVWKFRTMVAGGRGGAAGQPGRRSRRCWPSGRPGTSCAAIRA